MIEKILLDYLNDILNVPVYMEVPERNIKKYVVLEKTGSSKVNKIPTATIAVQSYGPTLYDAAELNEQVKTVIESAIVLPEISAIRLNSDYNFTNPTTKQYRYQALYVITYLA